MSKRSGNRATRLYAPLCPSANQLRCGPPVESTVCRLRGDDTYPPTRPQSTCCATARTSGVVVVHWKDSCVCSSLAPTPPRRRLARSWSGRSAPCALMSDVTTKSWRRRRHSVSGPEYTHSLPPPHLALSISYPPAASTGTACASPTPRHRVCLSRQRNACFLVHPVSPRAP